MSGTVPPPPPPPGPASQGSGGVPPQTRGRRASSASPMPPSITPGASGEQSGAESPDATARRSAGPTAPQAATVHAPVPPAPAGPPASAPPPARQPAYQQQVYQQPSFQQPAQQQPAQPQHYGYTPEQYAYQQPAGSPGTTQNPTVPGGGRRKRRLTPGLIAFIVLDVVLIAVALVFTVDALGGSDVPEVRAGDDPAAVASQGTDGEGSDESGTEDEDAKNAAGEQVAEFASPSRNITCQIFENAATCGLAELDQQPAPVEGCDGTTGYVVTLDGEGKVALPCVATSDTPKTAPKKLEQLAYGESTTEGDFTCTSEQNGMSCRHDPTGNGFSLARAGVSKL